MPCHTADETEKILSPTVTDAERKALHQLSSLPRELLKLDAVAPQLFVAKDTNLFGPAYLFLVRGALLPSSISHSSSSECGTLVGAPSSPTGSISCIVPTRERDFCTVKEIFNKQDCTPWRRA